jgi:aspartokinase
MTRISDMVKIYVKQRPYLKICLEKNILNYSATAREIKKHIRASPEAIKASLIRMSKSSRKRKKINQNKLLTILRNSSIEVKNKIAIVIAKDYLNISTLATVEGPNSFTHMIEESKLKNLKRRRIIKIEKGLDMISLLHPPEIEFVPGVDAFILDAIAAENININHLFSCHNDTLLIIKNTDTIKTFKILKELFS